MTAEWLKPRLEGSSGRRLELMSGANLARSKVLCIVLGATAGLLGGFAVMVRPVGILLRLATYLGPAVAINFGPPVAVR